MIRLAFLAIVSSMATTCGSCPCRNTETAIVNLTPFSLHIIESTGETVIAPLPPGGAAHVYGREDAEAEFPSYVAVIAPGQPGAGKKTLVNLSGRCAEFANIRPGDFQ